MGQSIKKDKTYLSILFGVYLITLVYCMFFGFGRPHLEVEQIYRYSLVPTRIPLWIPNHLSLDILQLWIFSLGNLLAFVPFGLLIPLLFKNHFSTYRSFIFLFVLFIVCMEILQMATYLGSFDSEDIIINTIGATIGFIAYKISERMETTISYWLSITLAIVGTTIVMFLVAWLFNQTITPFIEKSLGL